MREIKFRAFIEEDKEFIHWSVGDKSNWFWEQVRCDDLIVQQFTGLKDKNEKEIYEGDILKVPERYSGDYLDKEFEGEIRFIDGSFDICDHWDKLNQSSGWDYLSAHEAIYCYNAIVIGNIYENPELIEGNK